MSFSSVFKSLQELFPQVDRRMLKAVAIEHTQDVDAAVEFILNEVLTTIPCATETPNDRNIGLDDRCLSSEDQEAVKPVNTGILESNFLASEHGDGSHHSHHTSDASDRGSPKMYEDLVRLSVPNFDQPRVSSKPEESSSPAMLNSSNDVLNSLMHDDNIFFECNNVDHAVFHDLNEPAAYNSTVSVEDYLVEPCSTANSEEIENLLVRPDELVEKLSESGNTSNGSNKKAEENNSQETSLGEFVLDTKVADVGELVGEVSESASSSNGSKKPEENSLLETSCGEFVLDAKVPDFDYKAFSSPIATQSGQICKIDALEEAITEAKNNKKTLFLSMESVINMMREVEDLEKAAECAKEEAVRGGVDILSKVEDIRQMLQHAKEANDMHAGEVYGERSILTTEARELQSRLLNLSSERDRSLAILDEMRQVLEVRMKDAEEIKEAAEHDRHEKECIARKALVEQELIMDKVVQESKRLQSEAEENSKLQEFLVDRGKVVDILQGELSVICQDVRSLKENFDERVPISKLLSSSHTSCILASSGITKSLSSHTSGSLASSVSSSKSIATNLVPEQVESSESEQMINTTPVYDLPEKATPVVIEGGGKKLIDDDWDLFDDEAELYKSLH